MPLPISRGPLLASLAALLLLLATGCDRSAGSEGTSVAVAGAVGGSDTTGYARARSPRPFSFPQDHGPHPGFKTEWWYFTGNLKDQKGSDGGRHFGYQFTIFRVAVAPPDSAVSGRAVSADGDTSASGWRTDQFFMAHLAVSDVQNEKHYDFERFSRGAAGLAGAQASPFRVWVEDWEATEQGDASGDADPFPLRLKAQADDENGRVALDLRLTSSKKKVLQGERGLSQKGPGAGNASYYYSFTRLPTEGTVSVGGEAAQQVQGASWMDREWSTSALGAGQEGWDWFSVQLSDGRDLMYYQLRQKGGAPSRFSEGVLVGPQGEATRLSRQDVALDVQDRWTSARGVTYPARWHLRVPSEALDLTVTPYFDDQLMDTSVRYWEGAVQVDGTAAGQPVGGSGYVELTGYGERQNGSSSGRGVLP